MIRWMMISHFFRSAIKNFLFFLAMAVIFSLAACKKKQVPSYIEPFKNTSDGYALVFLSSMEGYVEPCGCTSSPLGGLARFTTVFLEVKQALNGSIQLMDTGNLLFDSIKRNDADKCQDDERIKFLLTTLKDLGLKYTIHGPFDDARGSQFRDDVLKSYGISALKSADNYQPKLSALDFIKINEKAHIGIIGISEPIVATDSMAKDARAKIKLLSESARKDKNLKALVAISQMPEALTKEVFTDLSEIDVVIQGRVTIMAPKTPYKLGKGPIYVEGGRQGQNFTVLVWQNLANRNGQEIQIDNRSFEKNARLDLLNTRVLALKEQLKTASKERVSFLKSRLEILEKELQKPDEALPPLKGPSMAFHAIPLTKKIVSEPIVKASLDLYEKNIPSLVKKCEENIECPKADPKEATYVGVETCKNCHQAAYDVWKKAVFENKALDDSGKEITRIVGHSKAWKTLKDINKDTDRACIGCHSIGFMQKGGYCKAYEVDFRVDVQCESCHGPGSLHAQTGDKKFIKRQVLEETCRGCHHVPHIPSYESFNYEEKIMKILGPGHGEKLLKELSHKPKA